MIDCQSVCYNVPTLKYKIMTIYFYSLSSTYLYYQDSSRKSEYEKNSESPSACRIGGPLVQHHLVRLQRGGEGGDRFKSMLPVLASERK